MPNHLTPEELSKDCSGARWGGYDMAARGYSRCGIAVNFTVAAVLRLAGREEGAGAVGCFCSSSRTMKIVGLAKLLEDKQKTDKQTLSQSTWRGSYPAGAQSGRKS